MKIGVTIIGISESIRDLKKRNGGNVKLKSFKKSDYYRGNRKKKRKSTILQNQLQKVNLSRDYTHVTSKLSKLPCMVLQILLTDDPGALLTFNKQFQFKYNNNFRVENFI